ncbi:MAG TPA: hypothetical protein VGH65_07370 [Verrucomicrobiaceae bacterium]
MNRIFIFIRPALPFLLAICGWSGTILSQAPDPPPKRPPPPPREKSRDTRELREMREQFTLRALTAGRLLAEQYTNALATLESQAADAADYETALAAQERQRELAGYYANRDLDSEHLIVLKPVDAKTVGAVAFDKTEGALTNWRTAGSSAVWDVFKITPGSYNVTLVCAVAESAPAPAQTGGDIEFGEVTSLSGPETTRLALSLESTGGWDTFESFALGEIKLAHTSARFAIKATRLRGTGGLMHLKEVRLAPSHSSSEPIKTELAKFAMEKLKKTREDHLTRIRDLEQPVLNAHLAKLNALGDEFTAKGDQDGARAVVAEAKRAQKSLEKTDKSAHSPRYGIFSEGLEEVHDATFIDDPTNTGDRFLVMARGEKISVKLMSVSCPSPDAAESTARDFHTRYFRIAPEDCTLIGRQAQDFTAAYLKDKSLKLLTRWQKDSSNSVLAAVQPEEVGDFAGILVDNGLAAILEPTSKNSTQHRVEENTRNALKQRESVAKSRPIPPGAWSLAAETKPAP